MKRLCEVMARLRSQDGCPWDREQTHATLAPYLIEECCELLDTIDRGDFAHMLEELGDVLLQVVFHAQLASESGRFDLEAVAGCIADKLVRRHPHVFGEGRLETSAEVLHQWERIKKSEKGVPQDSPELLVKPVPATLPALLRAVDAYRQLSRKGALPADDRVFDEGEVSRFCDGLDDSSAGRRLFALAAACRRAGIDPESALRRHVSKVIGAASREGPPSRP